MKVRKDETLLTAVELEGGGEGGLSHPLTLAVETRGSQAAVAEAQAQQHTESSLMALWLHQCDEQQ